MLVPLLGFLIYINSDGEALEGDFGKTPGANPPIAGAESPNPAPAKKSKSSEPKIVNGYYVFEGATLFEHRGNDGDSFRVKLAGEDEPIEFRLYFVDCPEKYYDTNVRGQAARVEEQAAEFGISVEQTVAAGKKAREFVLKLLAKRPFTIYTAWDEVYDSERFHAFVEVESPEDGKPIYLSELLVRKGLVRIHTWGEQTPDGQHWREYKEELRRLEALARRKGEGVWGMGQ